jgi:hypothetical protein
MQLNSLIIIALSGFALIVVYLLPFWFPISQQVASISYLVGFNNKVSLIGAILMFFVFLGFFYWSKESGASEYKGLFAFNKHKPKKEEKLFIAGFGFIYLFALIYLFIFISGGSYWSEGGHFLARIERSLAGLVPYKDYEYTYGLGFIYLPLLFYKILNYLNLSLIVCYHIFLGIVELIGLGILWYYISSFAVDSKRKIFIFSIFAFCSFGLSNGLNYTILRFLLPFACIILVHETYLKLKQSGNGKGCLLSSGVALLCGFTVFMFSPEIGIASLISLLIYLIYQTLWVDKCWPINIMAYIVVCVLAGLLLPREIFITMINFSGGGNNLPFAISLLSLLCVFSLFFVVTKLIIVSLDNNNDARAVSLAVAVLCLFMLPGAFGRSDPAHIYWYGMGMFVTVLCVIARQSGRRFLVFAGALLIGIILYRTMAFLVYYQSPSLKEKNITVVEMKIGPDFPMVAVPFDAGADVLPQLIANNKVNFDYYLGLVNVFTKLQMDQKKVETLKNQYLLVPIENYARPAQFSDFPETGGKLNLILGTPFPFRQKNDLYNPKKLLQEYIELNYRIKASFGNYLLLMRTN